MMTDVPTSTADARQRAILTAAFEVFRLYGFRLTAMEDIGQKAGMSRAAPYLHYRNKEDIFQSLVQAYFDQTIAEVTRILTLGLPPAQALSAAFAAQGGPIIAALINSPHGAEFMDAKTTVSAEIVKAGEARLTQAYADWLRREVAAGLVTPEAVGGDADALAGTMMAALNGMKAGVTEYSGYAAAVARLAAVLGRGLAV